MKTLSRDQIRHIYNTRTPKIYKHGDTTSIYVYDMYGVDGVDTMEVFISPGRVEYKLIKVLEKGTL